jgi:hypothetical protein
MIEKPMELLELQNNESTSFRPLRYEKGRITITTRQTPGQKEVDCLRVHVSSQDKPTFPYYWDITAGTLIAQLEPHLREPGAVNKRFTVTAVGVGVQKRFRLESVPQV